MPKGTYDSAKSRGNLEVIGRGGNGNGVLIPFESLHQDYRRLVIAKYGDPYEYMANQPILDRIKYDLTAERWYVKYRTPDNKPLKANRITEYSTAIGYLNFLKEVKANPRIAKDDLKLTMGAFWQTMGNLIKTRNVSLPTHRIRLAEKIESYNQHGYSCMIEDFRFGNSNGAKIKDPVAKAFLEELIAHPHKHDDTIIMQKYNEWAEANGREKIETASTVGKYRRNNDWKITPERVGMKGNNNKYGKVIHRKRPSAPLLMLNSDDNDLDLFFKHTYIVFDKKMGKDVEKTTEFKRYTLMVVMDAYNDYILGYAIGDEQTHDLIRAAYLDAMYHIKHLTGQWYLPHQIVSDRWGLDVKLQGTLANFYKSLGTYTPALQYNARSKHIERAFGVEWHQQLKFYPNYAGFNVKAKEELNPDAVAINKGNYPSSEEAPTIIAQFIETMRNTKDRKEKWKAAFKASAKSQERLISDEQFLMIMGIQHETGNGRDGNTITNDGLRPTIGGVNYHYEVPEALYLQTIGKKVQIYHDGIDMSRVLVTDGQDLRFVATQGWEAPSALADRVEGDGARLHAELEQRKRMVAAQAAARDMRAKTLQDAGIDAQSVLKAGILTKGIKQAATQQYIEQRNMPRNTEGSFDIYSEM
jgi:hypothetical protein